MVDDGRAGHDPCPVGHHAHYRTCAISHNGDSRQADRGGGPADEGADSFICHPSKRE